MILPIINNINSVNDFNNLLANNPGLIIIKLTAEWCGPCKTIESKIKILFENMPKNVQCVVVDIDKCIDFYSYLKKRRVINGVPSTLCYLKGNNSYIPDDFVIGASIDKISELNDRCLKNAVLISNNLIKIDYSKIKPIKPLPSLLPDKDSESISEPMPMLEKKSTLESNEEPTPEPITEPVPEPTPVQIEEVIVNNTSKKEKYILKNKTRRNINKILVREI
jgi:thiol-disulfide isomerase/thioredoxin